MMRARTIVPPPRSAANDDCTWPEFFSQAGVLARLTQTEIQTVSLVPQQRWPRGLNKKIQKLFFERRH